VRFKLAIALVLLLVPGPTSAATATIQGGEATVIQSDEVFLGNFDKSHFTSFVETSLRYFFCLDQIIKSRRTRGAAPFIHDLEVSGDEKCSQDRAGAAGHDRNQHGED
jgi:hypothetical protein